MFTKKRKQHFTKHCGYYLAKEGMFSNTYRYEHYQVGKIIYNVKIILFF